MKEEWKRSIEAARAVSVEAEIAAKSHPIDREHDGRWAHERLSPPMRSTSEADAT
jgi:hypothetical protein